MSTKNGKCLLCSTPLALSRWSLCGTCADIADADPSILHADQHERERRLSWERVCPSTSKLAISDLSRFPEPLERLAREWVPEDGKGLILWGPTGLCKTRCAIAILKRLHFAPVAPKQRPLRTAAVSSPRFADLFTAQGIYSEDYRKAEEAGKRLREIQTAGLLLFDDLGAERFTARVATEFFTLADDRLNLGLPTIWTTNYSQTKMCEHIGPAEQSERIARRIRESAQGVELTTAMRRR